MNLQVSESPEPAAERAEIAARGPFRRHGTVLGAFVCYALAILLYQRLEGAPAAAFGAYPDEPSHYISGLLIRDYLVGGAWTSPVSFAQAYYLHVPYFAVGYWPPLFYFMEGLWMIVFGPGRTVVLALVALVAAGCSAQIFASLREKFGNIAAFGAGFIFLLFPVVMWSSSLIMTDLLVALLSFAAALAFARYLDSERSVHMIAFSVLAAAAILTKSSAAFLVLVPPAAALVSGKAALMKRMSFWVAVPVVAVLCFPWFLLTRRLIGLGFENYQKPGLIQTFGQLGYGLLENTIWLVPFILIGAWYILQAPRPLPGLAAVCIAQPLAVLVLLIVAPVGNEPRYLISAFPALVVLSIYGIRATTEWLPAMGRSLGAGGLTWVLLACFLAVAVYRFSPLPPSPFRSMADFVIDRDLHAVLVPADAEGPTIAEISEREPDRMKRFLIRPGKLITRTNWTGSSYINLYKTQEEMQVFLDQLSLDAVVLRMDPPADAAEHELVLRKMVLTSPEHWRLVASFNDTSSSKGYAAFEPVPLHKMPQQELTLFLRTVLNKNLALPQLRQ